MTGTLFAPVMTSWTDRINSQLGTSLEVVAVENKYFGGDVSVAGLLTGECFLNARDKVRGDFIVIPGSSLKSGEAVMLDGMILEQLEHQLDAPVYPMDFASFAHMLTTGEQSKEVR
jgi:NifB/MoaA-like Fe-S oxidoreductase